MTAPSLRLNKALAEAGIASRRKADALIAAGYVRLNGLVTREPGMRFTPGVDVLEVEGRRIEVPATPPREVWALYKPKRCVSTLDDPQGRPTLKDYFPRTHARLFPIGRLDYDAEGLILLTNDGDLAHRVAHPSYGMEKVYLVKVKGLVQPETLKALARGPVLDGRRRGSVKARILHTLTDKTWLEVMLREGIQHHIKKMFATQGHPVLKIKRYRIGGIELADLQAGQHRRLNQAEVESLLNKAASPEKGPRGRHRRARPMGVPGGMVS